MPVQWRENNLASEEFGASFDLGPDSQPIFAAYITPNRSLSRRGLARLMLAIWAFVTVPLLALLGTAAFCVILGFLSFAMAALWYFIERNNRDGTLFEELLLWPDRIAVTRFNPRAESQSWHAHPHWTTLNIKAEGGPVENYLTLKGNQRTIELGTFLSPQERRVLYDQLGEKLAQIKTFRHER